MSNQFQFQNPYVLPSQNQSVPDEWKSDTNARPISSSMQTVVVTSLSATQNAGGRINLQIPCGPSAGIMANPYIKFTLNIPTVLANASKSGRFGFPAQLCTALFNRYVFSINGVQVDNIMNADMAYDTIIGHSSSADYQRNDLSILMGCRTPLTTNASGAFSPVTYCVPLLGALSAPSVPLYLLNGSCSIDIDLNTSTRAFGPGSAAFDPASVAAYNVSNVQLVYDRITVSDEFLGAVKGEQMSGKKFVVPYTNIQSFLVNQQANNNLNLGVNVSSLNSVICTQVLTASLANNGAGHEKKSEANQFGNLQVSLDGRLLSSVTYANAENADSYAVAFCESQKALSRAWDSAVSDPVATYDYANDTVLANKYVTDCFFAAVSALRCSSRLAFSGQPCSTLNIAWTIGEANPQLNSANWMVLSSQQMLIDATGSIELLR
jgi:hypothetical protein